jgi:putative membrane protein
MGSYVTQGVGLVILLLAIGGQCLSAQTTASCPNDMDKSFMMNAMSEGLLAVRLGNAAVEHAGNEAVKKVGERIAADESKFNEELAQLAKRKGVELRNSRPERDWETVLKFSKFNGAEFDRAYLDFMIPMLQRNEAAFETEARNGQDPDVKDLAARMVPIIQEHLKTLSGIDRNVGGHSGSLLGGSMIEDSGTRRANI